MIIRGVDPRDVQWEVERPAYRVYFWHQPPAPPGVPQEQMGWHCDEHRLSEVSDVEAVVAWARTTARPDQTFVVFVEHEEDGRTGLLRVLGADPH